MYVCAVFTYSWSPHQNAIKSSPLPHSLCPPTLQLLCPGTFFLISHSDSLAAQIPLRHHKLQPSENSCEWRFKKKNTLWAIFTYLISRRFLFLLLPPNLGIISVGFLDFDCGNFDHDGATEPRGFKARCPGGGRSGKYEQQKPRIKTWPQLPAGTRWQPHTLVRTRLLLVSGTILLVSN